MPGQATEVWAHAFARRFEALPPAARGRIIEAVRELGRRLDSFPHYRMQSLRAYRLRIGDHRVIYDFSRVENSLDLITVGHHREVYR